MKIRRILATAVAVAVTTPGVLLCAGPAFADTDPTARAQERPSQKTPSQEQSSQRKPSIAELEEIADEAQKAYDAAAAAASATHTATEEALSDTAPPTLAAAAARKAAQAAATAKTDADKAVLDAKAAVEDLTDTATDEERAAAEKALADAATAAVTAAANKTAADAEAVKAGDAADDARVAALRDWNAAEAALKKALAAKTAADEALAEAREEEEENGTCVSEPDLTAVVTGLPSTIVAGTTVSFSFRLTNGTDKAMDDVSPYISVHAFDTSGLNEIDDQLSLQWSTASSPKWRNVDNEEYVDSIGSLKAGAHADIKLRLAVDASAPAGRGTAYTAGDYYNDDESCGGTPDLQEYGFGIKTAGSKPGKVDDATPGTTDPDSGPRPQGSSSSRPVTTATGSLAATGSSSATSLIGLASGASLVIGAGAVFLARRRTAGSHA